MIPVHDAIPIRTRPIATYALLGLLAGLAFVPGNLTWRHSPSGIAGISWLPGLLVELITHRDWVHLASNMLALWTFGPVLEDRMGHGRYVVFASACALIGAAVAVAWRVPPAAFAGASGLAAGLVAAYTRQFPRSRVVVPIPVVIGFELADVPAWFLSVFCVAIQLVDLVPPAAIGAGGAAGLIGMRLLLRRERLSPEWWSPGEQGPGGRRRATGKGGG